MLSIICSRYVLSLEMERGGKELVKERGGDGEVGGVRNRKSI